MGLLTCPITCTYVQEVVAHGVCGVVEEVGDLLFGLAVEGCEHFAEQFDIVSATGFEDLLLRRSALRRSVSVMPICGVLQYRTYLRVSHPCGDSRMNECQV